VLNNATLDGLHSLKLPGMARGLLEQREHPHYSALGFEERLGMLVDRELTERRNRPMERMLKSARLRLSASIEGVEFGRPRGLDRSQILSLAESHWVRSHQSILIVGATGLGKTYIGCALANAAVRHGHTALYLRGPRLHDEISLARADGRLARLMATWARTDVLLIDDFLLRPLAPDQAADLLEVREQGVGRGGVAEDFIECRSEQCRILDELDPLVGVASEQFKAVADEVGGGVVPADQQQPAEGE
jgi:DNA replication protein DnaC